ncbi:MAG TPA: valine--tRNA ligase, partial [Rhodospirillales bacterium]|nr:valine--tRNA ligase [Rhodospirillales bacterium]
PGAKVPLLLKDASDATRARLDTHRGLIITLARLDSADVLDGDVPKGSVQDIIDEASIVLPLAGILDIAAEQARLEKEAARLEGEIAKHDKKLANKGFTDKAPADVVETERTRRADEAAMLAKIKVAMERLKAL